MPQTKNTIWRQPISMIDVMALSHRLLFDQNASHRLIGKIHSYFPNAKQVRQLKLENATD